MVRKTLLLGAAMLAGSMSQASPADAVAFSNSNVYACDVGYYPKTIPPTSLVIVTTPSNGDFGRVTASFYSSPYCAGSFVRLVNVYSQGSNVLNWTPEDTYEPYPEAAILEARSALHRAADEGARVNISGINFPGLFVGSTVNQLHSYVVRPN